MKNVSAPKPLLLHFGPIPFLQDPQTAVQGNIQVKLAKIKILAKFRLFPINP